MKHPTRRHGPVPLRISGAAGRLLRSFLPLFWLSLATPGSTQPLATAEPVPEHAYLSYLEENVVRFPGQVAEQTFVFRLPEHVRFREGSQVVLQLHGTQPLLQQMCSLNVLVNGASIYRGSPPINPTNPVISLVLAVPENFLVVNWNRLSLAFTLQKPASTAGTSSAPPLDSWEIRRSESFFDFAFERIPLFPELRRYPHSMAEEELLPPALPRSAHPAVVLLLPESKRDIHARAVAVLGTTLGKPDFLYACDLGLLQDWQTESTRRNGILMARKDELQGLSLPSHLRPALNQLRSEEGLLAEFITGSSSNQFRWILVSGLNDTGLENALLTLSHESALLAAPPNPAVIRTKPLVAGPLEAEAAAGTRIIPLGTPSQPQLEFRGIYLSEQTFSQWRLPPGYQTGPGTVLNLKFSHARALTSQGSHLQVLLNGQEVGRVPLDDSNRTNGVIQLSLPTGLSGRQTEALTFRAHLDLATAQCDPPATEEAWLTIAGDSYLESNPQPLPRQDLGQLEALLMPDRFMRQTAFLLPRDASQEEWQWFLNLALALGRLQGKTPVTWPEAFLYDPDQAPPADRLQNKSVLLLGNLAGITGLLESQGASRPLVSMPSPSARHLQIQGSHFPTNRWETSLGLLMLQNSPWSESQPLIVACGLRTFDLPSLARMLYEQEGAGKRFGKISAMDDQSRWAGFNPDRTNEPFWEILFRRIPAGLSLEQTLDRELDMVTQARRLHQLNFSLMLWVGVALLLLILCRVWLMWERNQLHRRWQRPAPTSTQVQT